MPDLVNYCYNQSNSICDWSTQGNYSIDLPNGCYILYAFTTYWNYSEYVNLPYQDTYIYDVCIYNEEFIQDIYLDPYEINGSVSGYVNDGNDGAVANATVYAYGYIQTDDLSRDISWNFETLTDSSGYYMIDFPKGEYDYFSASKEGYRSDWKDDNIIIDYLRLSLINQ